MMKSDSRRQNTALKTGALVKQTAEMEAKLAEMKSIMAKERAKREHLMSASTSTIWKNGGGNRGSAWQMQTAAQASTYTATGKTNGATTQANQECTRVQELPSSRAVFEEATKVPSKLAANRTATSICLLQGSFNEQESHASFLSALQEWRMGFEHVAPAVARTTSESGFTTEVQTENKAAPTIRSASAFGGSYFSKLFLSSASQQAGGVAGAAELRSRPSSAMRPDAVAYHGSVYLAASTTFRKSDGQDDDVIDGGETLTFENDEISANDQLLARLEQIEELEEASSRGHASDDDDEQLLGPSKVEIHSQTGLYGLTARTRLPDSILIPQPDHDEPA